MKRVYAKAAMSPEVRAILLDPGKSMILIRDIQQAKWDNKETFTSCGLTLSRRRPRSSHHENN